MNVISVHTRDKCVGKTFFKVLLIIVVLCCCVAELLRNIRTQVLIKLIKPYTRIHIPFISKVSLCQNMSCTVTLSVISTLSSHSLGVLLDNNLYCWPSDFVWIVLNGLFPFLLCIEEQLVILIRDVPIPFFTSSYRI